MLVERVGCVGVSGLWTVCTKTAVLELEPFVAMTQTK